MSKKSKPSFLMHPDTATDAQKEQVEHLLLAELLGGPGVFMSSKRKGVPPPQPPPRQR